MSFCIFCGSPLVDSTGDRSSHTGRTCESCGRFDELNIKFCVHCGSSINKATIAETPTDVERPASGAPAAQGAGKGKAALPPQIAASQGGALRAEAVTSSKRLRAEHTQAVSAKIMAIAAPEKSAKRGFRTLVWLGYGVLGGACLALLLFQSGLGARFQTIGLPEKGLAVYTEAPYVTVTVQDPDGKNFTIGATSKDGSLYFDNLETGKEYRMKLDAPGFQTIYLPVFKLDPKRATVIGYPRRLKLPVRHI